MDEEREVRKMMLQNKLLSKFWFPSVAITTTIQTNNDLVRIQDNAVEDISIVSLQIKPYHFRILSILLQNHIRATIR